MFSSSKLAWVAVALYTVVVFAPGMLLEGEIIPQQYLVIAMVCCALFLAGLLVGTAMLPFAAPASVAVDSPTLRRGLGWTIVLQVLITAYVFAIGPTSPMIAAMGTDNGFDVAMLREDAIKLNADLVFVRIYSWGRDVFSPIVFILSLHELRFGRCRRFKMWAGLGLLAAVALGLWSGQKATVVNYLLAAIIFSAASGWGTVRQLIKVVPVVLLVIAAVFAITLPQLFSGDRDSSMVTDVLLESIMHRVLLSPLEVSAAYVYAIDSLNIISWADVLPLATAWWTPGITSIENQIGVEFFYSGIESIHANALAFAYAYVLAGYAGCFFGGVFVVAVYKACIWLVRSSGSTYMVAAYGAYLCYNSLDLLNSNFLSYLLTSALFGIVFWVIGSVLRPQGRALAGTTAPATTHPAH